MGWDRTKTRTAAERGKQGASVVAARAAAAEEGSQLSKFRKLSLTLHGEK